MKRPKKRPKWPDLGGLQNFRGLWVALSLLVSVPAALSAPAAIAVPEAVQMTEVREVRSQPNLDTEQLFVRALLMGAGAGIGLFWITRLLRSKDPDRGARRRAAHRRKSARRRGSRHFSNRLSGSSYPGDNFSLPVSYDNSGSSYSSYNCDSDYSGDSGTCSDSW